MHHHRNVQPRFSRNVWRGTQVFDVLRTVIPGSFSRREPGYRLSSIKTLKLAKKYIAALYENNWNFKFAFTEIWLFILSSSCYIFASIWQLLPDKFRYSHYLCAEQWMIGYNREKLHGGHFWLLIRWTIELGIDISWKKITTTTVQV